MEVADTLPKVVRRNYKEHPDKVSVRNKEFGVWREYTWKEYYEAVKYFSLGLMSMGFDQGDKLSVIGDNEPQWFWAEIAAQAIGGVAVGIYVDCVPEEVKYIVNHSESSFVVAKDQEQVDKILEFKEEAPQLKKIIYWDPKGLWFYDEPLVMSFDQVVDLGKKYEELHPGIFEQRVEEGKEEDLAILCYTSGTTGLPKGVMETHKALLATAASLIARDPWKETDEFLSCLAPAWIGGQVIDISCGILSGAAVNFPEEPETIADDTRELGPSLILYTSRLWESLSATIRAKMEDTGFLKKLGYSLCLPLGYKRADLELEHRSSNRFWKALFWLADAMILEPLRDKVGLSRTRYPYTGGSMLSPDIFRFLKAIGVNLKQAYGASEVPIVTLQQDGDIKFESSGPPLAYDELRISKDNEILLTGPNICKGYYKNPEATKAKIIDGWFHSADAGYIDDDGHLIFLSRVADLMELAGGEKFSPEYIEGQLKFSPYIRDAIVVGGKGRTYVSCLVQIDYDIVGRWAERNHIVYTSFTDLSQKPQVYDLVEKDMARLNRRLPSAARVKKIVLLDKELDPDEAELTRTRKLRRDFVETKYGGMIAAIYGNKEEFRSETAVKYRDGRVGKLITAVKIATME